MCCLCRNFHSHCKLFQYSRFLVYLPRLVTSTERFFTVFLKNIIYKFGILRYDFRDFDIVCSNWCKCNNKGGPSDKSYLMWLLTKLEKIPRASSSLWKQISIMSVHVGSHLIFFPSVVGNFFFFSLFLSVVSNIFLVLTLVGYKTTFTPSWKFHFFFQCKSDWPVSVIDSTSAIGQKKWEIC